MESTAKGKWQVISGSWLKIIAMVTMLIDHTAFFFLYERFDLTQTLFTLGSTRVTVYWILRTIGRTAFPIYCFLLTEGYLHTKNRLKYGINLLIFALVSELPWNFVHAGSLLYGDQNVFFTLFFGYLCLCLLESEKCHPVLRGVGVAALFVLAYFFKADYGYMGVAVIIAMYLLRKYAVARAAVCITLLNVTWRTVPAFVAIGLYNGERGFIKGRVGKYICYAFYPLHLLILGVLRFLVVV